MRRKSFKDLLIWQKASKIFEMVCEDIAKWPKTKEANAIAYQLLDAVGSISANIAEGYGRGGPKEFEQFLRYSRGSTAETEDWLTKALMLKLIPNDRFETYVSLFEELNKMNGSFINRLRGQNKRS